MNQEINGLVDKASRGDAGAVDALLERHLPQLQAYIRLRAGRLLLLKESSSDLAQSVCREILTHMDRYQFRGEGEFRTWLYSTALRKIWKRYEHYTAEKRDVRRDKDLFKNQSNSEQASAALLLNYRKIATPSQDVGAAEELARIESMLARLPDDYREVILLSRVMGLPGKQVAELLGRSETAARSLLVRALAALAEEIDKNWK
ncbi:MAG: sigma-70 family RNA polymerase sigma factor [Planctomycetes bacterium]|nr:sigma-70 family RNA polymerase sigma factor [Planctomycetota bacterium]